MNKRRILVYVISAVVLIGSSVFVYIAKNLISSTEDVVETNVVQAEKTNGETKTGYLSDEEATEIALKTMKDYFNKDKDYFTETYISRLDRRARTEIEVERKKYLLDEKYARSIQCRLDDNDIEGAKQELQEALIQPSNIVYVTFESKDQDETFGTCRSYVEIKADTREIINARLRTHLDEFKGKLEEDKLKDSIINFFNKINKEVDDESVLQKYDIYDRGEVWMYFKLKDGNKVSARVDLKDYSVIGYTADYLKNL